MTVYWCALLNEMKGSTKSIIMFQSSVSFVFLPLVSHEDGGSAKREAGAGSWGGGGGGWEEGIERIRYLSLWSSDVKYELKKKSFPVSLPKIDN